MYIYGHGHYWFDYIFLWPGTIIFQVPPGNYQGAPQFLNFLWPAAVFLTVPTVLQNLTRLFPGAPCKVPKQFVKLGGHGQKHCSRP